MKVFVIAALTADGFIGRTSDHFPDWTGTADKKFFTDVTKRAGVMIMGRSTYDTIGRALPGRKTIVYTSRPLDNPEVKTTQLAPEELLKQLKIEGYQEVAICGGQAIYDMFLAANLVNELYLTFTPVLFGAGLSLIKTEMAKSLSLKEVKMLDNDTLVAMYEVKNQ